MLTTLWRVTQYDVFKSQRIPPAKQRHLFVSVLTRWIWPFKKLHAVLFFLFCVYVQVIRQLCGIISFSHVCMDTKIEVSLSDFCDKHLYTLNHLTPLFNGLFLHATFLIVALMPQS